MSNAPRLRVASSGMATVSGGLTVISGGIQASGGLSLATGDLGIAGGSVVMSSVAPDASYYPGYGKIAFYNRNGVLHYRVGTSTTELVLDPSGLLTYPNNWTAAQTVSDLNSISGNWYTGGSIKVGNSSAVPNFSLASTGIISAGQWQGTIVSPAYGGTGVANTGKTITIGGNLTTSGAYALTLTLGAATTVTLPATGTLATLAGSETFTNKTLTSPTLTAPTLGAATATTINKVTITQPANTATLTIVEGGTLATAGAYVTTLTSTAATNVTLPTTGTLATLAGSETFTNKTLTSPTLTTPTLGAATATTINKVTITQPANAATLTIVDGKTLIVNNKLTFSGTDDSTVAFGEGGTATYTTSKLSIFASTTSAELAGVISDETGSGLLVFATAPTFATSVDSGATFTAFASATTLRVGYTGTAASTTNISTGAVLASTIKTVNIGTDGAASSTTNVNIGSAAGGLVTVNSSLTVTGNLTVNGTTTTINSSTIAVDDKNIEIASVASAVISNGPHTIGTVTGNGTLISPWIATITGMSTTAGLVIGSAITAINGTTAKLYGGAPVSVLVTAIVSSTSITYQVVNGTIPVAGTDLGAISTTGASDLTADGAGITVKGASDKTLNWVSTTAAWTSSENFDLAAGRAYKIGASNVLSSSILSLVANTFTSTLVANTSQAAGRAFFLPLLAGTLIGTGDSATVTNTMLAGSIANNKLTNNTVQYGTTSVALGATSATIAGLTSIGLLSNSVATIFQGSATASATTYTLPPTAGSNGQTLTTNGSGVLSWGAGSTLMLATENTWTANQIFTSISYKLNTAAEALALANPAAGYIKMYFKDDGFLYKRTDSGAESVFSSGSGGGGGSSSSLAFATIFGTDLPIITGGSLSSAGSSFSITSDGLSLGVPAPDSTTGQISNINQLTLTDLSVAPGAPGTGKFTLYSRSGSLYYKSGTGAETLVGSGGGGGGTTTNTLTIGTGLSGTSFNGGTAVTIAVDGTVALKADTHYIGTTAVTLNRASSALALTGITSVSFPSSTFSTVLQGSSSATANATYTLPVAAPGTDGYVLTSTTAGVMSWAAASGGGASLSTANTWTAAQTFGTAADNSGASVNIANVLISPGTHSTVPGVANKIRLWGTSVNGFYGMGVSGGQVDYISDSRHVFWKSGAGTSFTCAATISTTTMTVTGTPGGVLAVGQTVVLAGTVTEGTMITALVSGTGGAGTYTVSISQTVSTSATVTIYGQPFETVRIDNSNSSVTIGSGRSSSVQASLDVRGQVRAPQYIIGNPVSGSSITYGAATSNNLLPPPMFQGGTGALTSVGTAATGSTPYGVAVDPTGRFVFVTNNGVTATGVQSYRINQSTGALTSAGTAVTMANPHGVAIDPTGRFAFVTGTSSVQAYTINQSTGALTSVGAVPAGTNPNYVAVDPTGRFVFVANYNNANVQSYTINQSTGALTSVGTTPTGPLPQAAAVDPTGRFVFVVNYGADTVQAYTINQSTGALTSAGAVATGTAPSGVVVDPTGRFAFVTNYGSTSTTGVQFYAINQSTGALTSVGTAATGTNPQSVAVDPTGRFAFVTNRGAAATGVQSYRINNFAANSGTFQDALGIGTTSPATLLHVDSSGYASFYLGTNGANGFHITKESTDQSFNIWSGAFGSGVNRLKINSSGDVGIGVTTVGAKLDVAGTLRLNGTTAGTNYTEIKAAALATAATYTLPSTVPSVTGQVLSSDTSGNMSWTTPTSTVNFARTFFLMGA